MLGNYWQQTNSAVVIFQMHIFLGALRVKVYTIFKCQGGGGGLKSKEGGGGSYEIPCG